MLQLTERDINIIKDIHKVKVLTIRQIRRLYFKEKTSYASRRMIMLKQNGYVQTKPLNNKNGRKETTCYYLTEKATRELELEASVAASRIMSGHLQDLRVQVNEIFVMIQTTNWPWIWLDSREIKKEMGLNRSSEIVGGIKIVENFANGGNTYGVYLISNNTSDKKINDIKFEINRNALTGLNRVIVFCETKDAFYRFGSEDLNTTSLIKLPFKFGLSILSFLGPKSKNISSLTKEILGTEPYEFTVVPYTNLAIDYEYEKYQFVDFLTNDLAKVNFVKIFGKQFTESSKCKILALVFDELYSEYEQVFRNSDYIKLLKIPHSLIIK